MIQKQFKLVTDLFKEKTEKLNQDISRNKQIRDLADKQFFESEHDEYCPSHIYEMPKGNRPNFKHLDPFERAIYVLRKSNAFTYEEIAAVVTCKPLNREKIKYLYKKLLTRVKGQ